MTNWRPSSPAAAAKSRAAMLQRMRDYFEAREVLAVDTPALSSFASSDVSIDSVVATLATGPRFLHTSPESSMKCLLAAGYPDIYSICRVFRDGERGRQHLPEFTLLEWYRLGFQLSDIVADTTALIAHSLARPDLANQVDVLDYADAFRDAANLDVFTTSIEELADAVSADASLRNSIGDDRNAWLDLMLTSAIMPGFSTDRLTVLRHYPRAQAALARICPDDRRCADRFEVFLGPLELANGYVELTDADEQRQRFEHDNEQRRLAGKPETAVDELLLGALQHGLPACAGVALGIERLQMIFDRVDNIDRVVTFSERNSHE
ncbi:MAG: EF-P lysine aminoacylase EpmA [Woeseiaceae bacterium]